MATSGAMNQKIPRQVVKLRITPATVGPSAGPTAMTTEIKPITEPRREAGTNVMVAVISKGTIIPVPIAWQTRARSRTAKVGAKAAMTVPMRNAEAAKTKTARVLKRLMSQPVVGNTTDVVSRKPVSNHWAVAAEMEKCAMIDGNATASVVSLIIFTKAVNNSTTRAITAERGMAARSI
ncbi:MAG: hypothetical protein BWY79_00304 [Actinobacteria bacterium ADurb.Bin444]|nr:MAG: hypothetical protein BWY79_00304 [Actinobacteria bacterium ADurb.Bin444]